MAVCYGHTWQRQVREVCLEAAALAVAVCCRFLCFVATFTAAVQQSLSALSRIRTFSLLTLCRHFSPTVFPSTISSRHGHIPESSEINLASVWQQPNAVYAEFDSGWRIVCIMCGVAINKKQLLLTAKSPLACTFITHHVCFLSWWWPPV